MTLPPKLEKLLDNWPAKIVSLIAAILVYAFYQVSSLGTRSFVVPLEVRESAGMICTDVSEETIRVSVRGKTTDINQLETKDFSAFADLGRIMNEETTLAPVQLSLSDTVRIMQDIEIKIQPESVEVKQEKNVSSYVPVKLNHTGGASHGYEIESVKTDPMLIKVSGPSSLVNSLQCIETDLILFDDLTQSVVLEARTREINGELTSDHEGSVIVKVEVVPSKMKRVLANLPVAVYPVKGDFITEAEQKDVTVTIFGNELDVEKYVPTANFAYADCSRITESGEYDIPVQYVKSSKFEIESPKLVTVHVTVTEIPVEEEPEESEEL